MSNVIRRDGIYELNNLIGKNILQKYYCGFKGEGKVSLHYNYFDNFNKKIL